MNLGYDAETKSLYIDVAAGVSAECLEIHDGVVLDFDTEGKLVGIDIHNVTLLPQELEIPLYVPAPEKILGKPTSFND